MQRRGFLGMLGSAAFAPMLPALPVAPLARASAARTGYSGLLYGMAKFHAQTRAGLTAADLMPRLGVSAAKANALMAELVAKGIVPPTALATQSTEAGTQTSHPHNTPKSTASRAPAKKDSTMEKFTKLTGTAAPMPLVNIDTDMIIPKIFLKTIKRSGLGVNLFDEMRYDRQGNEIPDFVLNKPQYRDAKILVAGDNFGCGSSREHAPWAIADFGIRCVISTSFADIFYNNCFKNGILPIVLPQEDVDKLMEDAERGANATVTVDLESQTIEGPDGGTISFEVDPFKKRCLLEGLDDIGLTMEKASAIDAFEAKASTSRPWA